MDMLDWIKTSWNYNYWAWESLWWCALSVSTEDFKRPVPYSVGSLHEQLVHSMWAEALWYTRINNQPRIAWTTADFLTRPELIVQWKDVQANWLGYIDNLTQAEIDRDFTFARMYGDQLQQNVGQTLLHIVNHGTDHRSQILRIIHDFGGKTFEQDMAYFFREQNS